MTSAVIIKESFLVNAGQNGVFLVKNIHSYNKISLCCNIGTFILTANQVVTPRRPFLRKKKKKSFYIRSVFFFMKFNHLKFSCSTNSSAILKKRLHVLGSMTFGPVPRTIKRKKLIASFNYKIIMSLNSTPTYLPNISFFLNLRRKFSINWFIQNTLFMSKKNFQSSSKHKFTLLLFFLFLI